MWAVTPSLGSAAEIQPSQLSQPAQPTRAKVLTPTGPPAIQPSVLSLTNWEHKAHECSRYGINSEDGLTPYIFRSMMAFVNYSVVF